MDAEEYLKENIEDSNLPRGMYITEISDMMEDYASYKTNDLEKIRGHQYYSHSEMVEIADKGKKEVLEALAQGIESNIVQRFDGTELISKESVLNDIKIVELNHGL